MISEKCDELSKTLLNFHQLRKQPVFLVVVGHVCLAWHMLQQQYHGKMHNLGDH